MFFILKVIGIVIITSVLVFAGKLWTSASALEKEIEAEEKAKDKDEIRGV